MIALHWSAIINSTKQQLHYFYFYCIRSVQAQPWQMQLFYDNFSIFGNSSISFLDCKYSKFGVKFLHRHKKNYRSTDLGSRILFLSPFYIVPACYSFIITINDPVLNWFLSLIALPLEVSTHSCRRLISSLRNPMCMMEKRLHSSKHLALRGGAIPESLPIEIS